MGSLAAVGVIGMADILIYKGKHLSKIIKKGDKNISAEFEKAKQKISEQDECIGKLREELRVMGEQNTDLTNKVSKLESESSKYKKDYESLYNEVYQ